jgi:hypothetical protein
VETSSHLVTFGVPLKLGSKVIQSNLITIKLEGMDVILGMDWMTRHKVDLDISDRVVETIHLRSGTPPCTYLSRTVPTFVPI